MRTTAEKKDRKKVETPIGKMKQSDYFKKICKENDLTHAYLAIRKQMPITWANVKLKWEEITGKKHIPKYCENE